MVHTANLDTHAFSEVKRFGAQLRDAGISFERLIIFGSYAKGTAKPWSDIDVCVVSRTFGDDRQGERVRLMNVQNDETIDIEPHPYHPVGLADKWDPLAHEIRTYGIPVV